MKKTILKWMTICCIISAVVFTQSSCKKARLNKETVTSEDNSTAENMFSDVFAQTDDAANDAESSVKGNFGGPMDTTFTRGCKSIRVERLDSSSRYPSRVTVDFKTGCQGSDGRTRRGKIVFEITAPPFQKDAKLTITPLDYYVNDYKIEGQKILTNLTGPIFIGFKYSIVVTNGKITTPDGAIILWNSSRENERIDTGIWSITGSGNGTNRDGRNFTVTIDEALIVKILCKWITKGKITLTPEDLDPRTLDFGDGTCDDKAVVTIKSRSKEITLR